MWGRTPSRATDGLRSRTQNRYLAPNRTEIPHCLRNLFLYWLLEISFSMNTGIRSARYGTNRRGKGTVFGEAPGEAAGDEGEANAHRGAIDSPGAGDYCR